MSDNFYTDGILENPKNLVEQVYQGIMDTEMVDMPFCNKSIPIYACPFRHYQQQWLGVLITPWTLSILIFPGPEQQWPARSIGDKIAIEINEQYYTFIINQHSQLKQYLACSLMSPITGINDEKTAKSVVKDLINKLSEIPLHVQQAVDLDKRNLFRRKTNNADVDSVQTR